MDFTKSTYSVIQNGEFTSFKISDGENIIAEWSDNCGLTHVAETVPEIAKPIVARMEAAQRKYYDEWDLFDGQGVYGRDGRTDEFGANWVEL